MKINKINASVFYGKIIDTHAHIGTLNGQEYKKEQLDVFVKSKLPNDDTVEKMYVSNIDVLTSAEKEFEGNKKILDIFKNNDKYEIFASCSPKDGSVENIKNLYKKYPNKLIGLKFHPSIQNLDLSDKRYDSYMEFADKNKIPCLFHSEVCVDKNGKINNAVTNISDPGSIYKLAKKYNKTPIVMAHLGAGWNEAHDRAIDILVKSVKKGDANLYADISWVDIGLPYNGNFQHGKHRKKEHVLKAIKKLKGIGDKSWKYGDQSFRLVFGSDAPIDRFSDKKDRILEYTAFIEDIKFAIRNDKDLKPDAEKIIDDLFCNNAKKLYLKKNTSETCIPLWKKNKFVWFGLGLLLLFGSIMLYYKKHSNCKNS